jgi:hypothetical protein
MSELRQVDADRKHPFEIVFREGAEGDERLGRYQALLLEDLLGDDGRHLFVILGADHDHEVVGSSYSSSKHGEIPPQQRTNSYETLLLLQYWVTNNENV